MFDKFLEDLTNEPNNWILRNIFADWAEENKLYSLHACLQWMITNNKRPYIGNNKSGSWFNTETIASDLGDPESDIPSELYIALEGGDTKANHKNYKNYSEAEKSLYNAWSKIYG